MRSFSGVFSRIALISSMVLGTAGVGHAASIIQNGGFEQTLINQSYQFNTTYTTQQVTGWTANGYTFVYLPGTADTTGATTPQFGNQQTTLWGPGNGSANGLGVSPTGGNFVALDGGFPGNIGSISQKLTGLKVGDTVTVSFYYAGAQQQSFNGTTTEGFDVTLGNQTLSTAVLNNANHGFTGWQQASLTFTVTSANETLTFLAKGTPDGEPPFTLLDGVSATDNGPSGGSAVTPEPSTLALLGTGVLSVGGVLRRRMKKS